MAEYWAEVSGWLLRDGSPAHKRSRPCCCYSMCAEY